MAVRRKKFDFQEALTMTGGAVAGGAVSTLVSDKISEFLPDQPELSKFAPIALGAYLSQNKNKMLSSAGLGMIGASGGALLEMFGVNGVGAPKRQARLNPMQQKQLLDSVMKSKAMRAAGVSRADLESQLAGVVA